MSIAVPVHFLYRERPEPIAEGDRHTDSGWGIRGNYRDLPQAEIGDRKIEYVAIARVLNADDTWLHLIAGRLGFHPRLGVGRVRLGSVTK